MNLRNVYAPVVLALAFIASGVSFPLMVLFERSLPHLPPAEKFATEGSVFHRLKDITTECVRYDAQWWSKCLCFCLLIAVIV